MQEMHGFRDTLHPPKFAVSNFPLVNFVLNFLFLVMQLPMPPVPRLRLPINLLTLTKHEQKPSWKQPEGQEPEKRNNRWTWSENQRFYGN